MEFSPHHPTVKLCLQGMALEDQGNVEEAQVFFLQAWNEAADDLGKFLAAYYLARVQENATDKLTWLKTALDSALAVQDDSVKSALPVLYATIAEGHTALDNPEEASRYQALAVSCPAGPLDQGPFYHGTKADLKPGDLLLPGGASNYQPGLQMNHIYFTAMANGAGLAAALAKGEGRERVYMVEPTGSFEDDPNVTNKKFPGNLTRSYRSDTPLQVLGEIEDWARQTPEQLQHFRERLAESKGKIIN